MEIQGIAGYSRGNQTATRSSLHQVGEPTFIAWLARRYRDSHDSRGGQVGATAGRIALSASPCALASLSSTSNVNAKAPRRREATQAGRGRLPVGHEEGLRPSL